MYSSAICWYRCPSTFGAGSFPHLLIHLLFIVVPHSMTFDRDCRSCYQISIECCGRVDRPELLLVIWIVDARSDCFMWIQYSYNTFHSVVVSTNPQGTDSTMLDPMSDSITCKQSNLLLIHCPNSTRRSIRDHLKAIRSSSSTGLPCAMGLPTPIYI